jgi:hypothetical protein
MCKIKLLFGFFWFRFLKKVSPRGETFSLYLNLCDVRYAAIFFLSIILFACKDDNNVPQTNPILQLSQIKAGNLILDAATPSKNTGIANNASFEASFSSPLDLSTVESSFKIAKGIDTVQLTYNFSADSKIITATPTTPLSSFGDYNIVIKKTLKGQDHSVFPGLTIAFKTKQGSLDIVSFKFDDTSANTSTRLQGVSLNPVIEVKFSTAVNPSTVASSIKLKDVDGVIPINVNIVDATTITITPAQPLDGTERHSIDLSALLTGAQQEGFSGVTKWFYTTIDPNPVFPVISDEELLTLVQKQTFKYFWDFGHPASGMARERDSSGDVVTSGGSGFGLMAIVVGIDRNFISRSEGVERLDKIVSFLEDADRFHGAWSHWINGNTGAVIPFSQKDDGGDLVETSFLVQGLLTARQYLQPSDTVGNNLIKRITKVWKEVEWNWYRKNNENVLYWHWSPNYAWDMNFPMYGYFEEQITYVLAAASPTYSIPKQVYTNGYGRNGAIVTNNTYYNTTLPLGSPAPLFWTQYSYLGMDPHFSDDYTNYWTQNVAASKINYAYCVTNPKNYPGYSGQNWGLTASDNQLGYSAHSPGNDLGVITPTAALSSFPYTPDESMAALKFFYYNLGEHTWGPYGFYDAFNIQEGWYANSYLAIDQGPIVVMMENYRTGLLWDLFMSAPEIQQAQVVLDLH